MLESENLLDYYMINILPLVNMSGLTSHFEMLGFKGMQNNELYPFWNEAFLPSLPSKPTVPLKRLSWRVSKALGTALGRMWGNGKMGYKCSLFYCLFSLGNGCSGIHH